MEFKIISFNPTTAQIVVEVGEMRLALDLPIDDEGYVPEGNELEKYVMAFIPVEALRRQRVLARCGGVRNAQSIQRLIAMPMPEPDMTRIMPDHFLQDINLSSL